MKMPKFNSAEYLVSSDLTDSGWYARFSRCMEGVVYEDGTFVLQTNGVNDPDARDTVRRAYGLDLLAKSEMSMYNYYEGDIKVPISRIDNSTLLVHPDLGVAVAPSYTNYIFSATSIPKTGERIRFSIVNRQKQKEFKEKYAAHIALGKTLTALDDGRVMRGFRAESDFRTTSYINQNAVMEFLTGVAEVPSYLPVEDLTNPNTQMLCKVLHSSLADGLLTDACADKHIVNHLTARLD